MATLPRNVVDHLVGPAGADPRVANWALIEDARYPLAITAAYLLAIPVLKGLMANREPMKLKTFSMVHNGILFFLSLYMVVETLRTARENFGWDKPGATLWCNPNDKTVTRGGMEAFATESGAALARVLHVHYLSKAYEFGDTIIMLLKKNYRQVSFLHVYHHATTFFPVWFCVVRYGPGGEAWFCCFLNSLVHVFMYGYYFGASLGVKIEAIKRSITQFQMVQFLLFIAQSVYILPFVTDCYRPRLSPYMLLVQCVVFFSLFFHFYVTTYLSKRPKRA